MEDFISSVSENEINDRLTSSISKRKPFRSFKDELYNFPEIQKKWYDYYNSRMKEYAIEWLNDNDIDAEITDRYMPDQ